ncbi:hypothetical protein AMATHDRAFT_61519 [Amanita thiersii Skay4041]|uniref:AAA+ ATPase domain-containing protein n=1 Tax=Amanita thiersii Skay4041 TaxID=703135 RepID=A0A2A9NPD7_9AGAR|nr:hypothetical protein AMATHDRAFT_61519 [Amanita thiersii Skay4041]
MNPFPAGSNGFGSQSSFSAHSLGLDLANSATRALGFSFLASFLTGRSLDSNVVEGMKLFVVGSVVEAGRRFCQWLYERFSLRYSITAQFDEGDPAYEWLVNFLTQQDVWRRSGEFTVSARSSKLKWGIKIRESESAEYVPKYHRPHLFRWRKYWVELQRAFGPPYAVNTVSFSPDGQTMSNHSLLLTLYTLDINVLSDLVEEARLGYVEGRRPHVIVHSIDTAFGTTWNTVKRKNRRSLDSIILPDGLLRSIVRDVRDFLATEDWYVRSGIPYRRGYLLYGPPGTGKTSTIYALAGELGLEIYTLSLSAGFIDDNMLQRLVSALPKHSILLIEDIDCAFPSREEEEEGPLQMQPQGGYLWVHSRTGYPGQPSLPRTTVTMSGLLNMLDGVSSEDGKLFFATTNYVNRLDPALIRPGRIDKKIEYKLATKGQARALFNRIYDTQNEDVTEAEKSPQQQQRPSEEKEKPESSVPVPAQDMDSNSFPLPDTFISAAALAHYAEAFAAQIPEDEFTTAELQGFLLGCRREPPEVTMREVGAWIEGEREEKRKRREAVERERERRRVERERKEDEVVTVNGGATTAGAGFSLGQQIASRSVYSRRSK